MIWAQAFVLAAAILAFLRSLNLINARHVTSLILIVAMAVMALELWCMGFYALMGISAFEARPWELWDVVSHTMVLPPKAIAALWLPPLALLGLWIFTKIAPWFTSSLDRLYGNAHFATLPEVRKMGLLNDQGIYVGKYHGRYLRYPLSNHVLLFAPSRSGKGVSIVIPNALTWTGSLLATDNKYEIFDFTSGYRAQSGHRIYRFSPAEPHGRTHRINPLDYIDMHNRATRVSELHSFLDILIRSGGEENQMWAEEARSLALALLLWLFDTKQEFSLANLAFTVKSKPLGGFLGELVASFKPGDFDVIALASMNSFVGKAEKEQSGVKSQLTAMLRLWEDPLVCAATACSDVDFRDMRKTPITLYLSFGTDQIARLAPLINLIVQQFLNVMLKSIPGKGEQVKVLCLLDEINRFGRMDKLKDGFGDLAGYGVHLLPVIQNLGQFHATYGGRDNTDIFLQNTDLKIAFRQNAETDKQFVSKELGTRTVKIKSRSYQTRREGASYNESRIERPLLSPDEIAKFDKNLQLLITGDGVVRCKKIVYYTDPMFKSKILPAITVSKIEPWYPKHPVTPKPNPALDADDIEELARYLED